MKRLKGLDSIRFICAIFVVLGHFGLPFTGTFANSRSSGLLQNSLKLAELIFNGPAAVIIFFIISGLVIHYAYVGHQVIPLGAYYSRRLLRIGIPAIIAIILYKIFHFEFKAPEFGTLWSIFCEIIYYLLYPLLFYIRKQVDWKYIISLSYIISLVLLFANLDALSAGHQGYPALGLLTWIVGLPCWLMGCWLAENYSKFKVLPHYKIQLLRALIILVVLGLRIAKFHISSVFASNCFTLNAFAFLGCIWLGYEIMYFQYKEPNKITENLGKWSYSLYLIHPVTPLILVFFKLDFLKLNHVALIGCALLFSYLFYKVVEKPSHRFSRFICLQFTTG